MQLTESRRRGARRVDIVNRGIPTDERVAKAGDYIAIGDDKRGNLITQMRDSPLERLHYSERLSQAQYDAGVKYRMHWHHGRMAGTLGSADLGRVFGGASQDSEFSIHHRDQYFKAVKHLGTMHAKTMDMAVCHEKNLEDVGYMLGEGVRSDAIAIARRYLQDALNRLREFWGI